MAGIKERKKGERKCEKERKRQSKKKVGGRAGVFIPVCLGE